MIASAVDTIVRTLGPATSLRGQLVRGGLGSVGVKAGGMALTLALGIVLARTLGPERYGTYAYVLALVSLLAIPAQLGLPTLVVRETARAHATQQWGLVRGIWRWSTLAVAGLSLALAVAGAVAAWMLVERFTSEQLTTFGWAMLLVPLVALGNLRGAALRGLRKVVQGQLPEQILRPAFLLLLLAAGLIFSSQRGIGASGAMAFHVVAAALAFAVGAVLLWRARPETVSHAASVEYRSREWIGAALPLALIAGLQLVNHHADLVMLGVLTSASEVGIYKVAVTGSGLVAFGLQAINIVVAPHFAQLHAAGDTDRLQQLVTRTARIILATALPVALVFVFTGRAILTLVFGDAYADADAAIAILAVGQLVNAGMGSVGMLLNMTGHERQTMRGVAVAAVVNVVLNATLIPIYGLEGAALATTASLMTWNWILRRAVRRELRLEPAAFGRMTAG